MPLQKCQEAYVAPLTRLGSSIRPTSSPISIRFSFMWEKQRVYFTRLRSTHIHSCSTKSKQETSAISSSRTSKCLPQRETTRQLSSLDGSAIRESYRRKQLDHAQKYRMLLPHFRVASVHESGVSMNARCTSVLHSCKVSGIPSCGLS